MGRSTEKNCRPMPMEIGAIRFSGLFVVWAKFLFPAPVPEQKSCPSSKKLGHTNIQSPLSWPSCCSSPGAPPAPNGRAPAKLADEPCRPLMLMFPILARRFSPWHRQLRPGQCSRAGSVDGESLNRTIAIRWRCSAAAAAGKSSICAAGWLVEDAL